MKITMATTGKFMSNQTDSIIYKSYHSSYKLDFCCISDSVNYQASQLDGQF